MLWSSSFHLLVVVCCTLTNCFGLCPDGTDICLGPDVSQLNWTNQNGGPILDRSDPVSRFVRPKAPAPAPLTATLSDLTRRDVPVPSFSYSYVHGYIGVGNDIAVMEVESQQEAQSACSSFIQCKAFTFSSNASVNGTIVGKTRVYLKKEPVSSFPYRHMTPWFTWVKEAPLFPAAQTFQFEGINIALRRDTYTIQWLNASRRGVSNFSFVPNPALPLQHHLGDVSIRVRSIPSQGITEDWSFFSSAWGPFTANATTLPLRPGEVAAHDITPLLDATQVAGDTVGSTSKSPVSIRRAYGNGNGTNKRFQMTFELTNKESLPIEIGRFGMSLPAAVSQDIHIGGAHGWSEWTRVHVNDQLALDEQCIIATPIDAASGFENFRPIFEFGGGAVQEWTVHSKAWAAEWEQNLQWPFLRMAEALNATGIWPNPRSPWPAWADGDKTARTNFTADTHWNPPTSRVLQPGESALYGLRFSACSGGPRSRDEALVAAGEPVLKGIPGFTLSTDMSTAQLRILPPKGVTVVNATVSAGSGMLLVGTISRPSADGNVVIPVQGLRRGRARLEVLLSDGSSAVAHYMILPPLTTQIERVARHWSEVAWLPRNYPDPFGRGASVLPWDREDGRHRFNDGRAYDVGLSDDAGAANNLGLATSQAFAPVQSAVNRLDEYIASTLYGLKNDTAKPPFKSLQLPEPNNGIRMTLFYYNQTYFPWNYTEQDECATVAGLNYNWCMTEQQANATYRGFNYPHQIAVWYSMYRTARNHPRLKVAQSWQWYLERAANTSIRLGFARIGYMDGTVVREVLRSVLEEGEADPGGPWVALGAKITSGEKYRADYFKTAPNPYGSEFSYDTTGQEEVVVWQLYFGYDDAAARTISHVLQYMRPMPNWAYNGGAVAGDVVNGGKWFVTAGTGYGDFGKMHYRAGLNQIPLIEWFRRHPDDIQTLEIAVGAMSGQMSNIDESGAPSIYFHAYPHVMEYDAYSGDYGLGFFGSSLESSATLVVHPQFGPLCYLCDLDETSNGHKVIPRDAYRQRVYLEPLGLHLQADSGVFEAVELKLQERRIYVTFAAALTTPAGTQTYDVLRLRADKCSLPDAKRPGSNFKLVNPAGAKYVRSAWEIPVARNSDAIVATIGYDSDVIKLFV